MNWALYVKVFPSVRITPSKAAEVHWPKTSCYCWPREAGSDSIRPSPCEMPPPNHRPPFPGPESSQTSQRVEKHRRLARLAAWASTAPGGGRKGSVSRLISLCRKGNGAVRVWVTFWGGEWAVWQEKGKKLISCHFFCNLGHCDCSVLFFFIQIEFLNPLILSSSQKWDENSAESITHPSWFLPQISSQEDREKSENPGKTCISGLNLRLPLWTPSFLVKSEKQ